MKIRTFATVAVALALAGGVAVTSPAAASDTPPTIAGILAAQGNGPDRNWYDFDILAAGIGVAAPQLPPAVVAGLDDPNFGPVTVFIPNDRAFQALVADLFGWKYWFASEATILAKVASLGPETLATVIAYHVVPGAAIDSTTALGVKPGTALTTLQGGDIRVYPLKRFGTAILADQDRNDANPFLVRSKLDIRASNGILHGISLVLRPSDL